MTKDYPSGQIPLFQRHDCDRCGLVGRAYHHRGDRYAGASFRQGEQWLCGHCKLDATEARRLETQTGSELPAQPRGD